ncbi:MAG TPA: hypothetical protein VF756_12485 [Thermoanaerobaculia bacterium]
MRYLARFATSALFLIALPLAAQTGAWTAVASTGTPDDSSAYATTTALFQHAPGALGTVFARYNVTNTYGMTDTPPWSTLELGYFDSSTQGHVTAILFQVDRCTGAVTFLCGKTSVDAISASCVTCNFTQPIDFSKYSYVVEVQVNRSSTNAVPAARTLRIY